MNWGCNQTAVVYGGPLAEAPNWQTRNPTDFPLPGEAVVESLPDISSIAP